MSRQPIRNLLAIGMGGTYQGFTHSTRGEWGFIHGTRNEGAFTLSRWIKQFIKEKFLTLGTRGDRGFILGTRSEGAVHISSKYMAPEVNGALYNYAITITTITSSA